VRAWGDEPVELFMHRIDKTTAYVGREKSDTVIGLPLSQVFGFDSGAFFDLRSAFESGDTNKLLSTYSKLAVNSPCNRYKINLESLHDKENVTDSGSVANCGKQ
jgi:hypothetical protein